PRACRLHETFMPAPKTDKPLRFAQFLSAKIVNGWIEEAAQLGDNRIVRLRIRAGGTCFLLYIRLWSNAANVVLTDPAGGVLDAMRRLPKRGEITGGTYAPEAAFGAEASAREWEVRDLPGTGSFNEKVDAWYAEHGHALSLERLREEARRTFEGSIGRIAASLERLRGKEAEYAAAGRLKEYGDIILAHQGDIGPGDRWLEAADFYAEGRTTRIPLEPRKTPAAQAEAYYAQYRKAKSGLAEIREEIAAGEAEVAALEADLARLLGEENPLVLRRLLKKGGRAGDAPQREAEKKKRPGLSFYRNDWVILVGRDASENDALLRRHVKGNDLWLHVRDYAGSYVFIKQRAGKSVPLEILLDAGNLALFYSKARNNGEADLFYTPVKYLRRVKDGPPGLVIPTQEKNLHIKADPKRLKALAGT
ncbi:MAG: NFACT RNA binding domain-containing protein, partial [Spirochaetaceae bacterium]|nr:NFACT RNA binding domain-containing protein [Spirochaetaceae bacterium]